MLEHLLTENFNVGEVFPEIPVPVFEKTSPEEFRYSRPIYRTAFLVVWRRRVAI